MEKQREFTEVELEFRRENREIYNRGESRAAWIHARDFYQRNPRSLMAQFRYGVMSGASTDDPTLSGGERLQLLATAKEITKRIFENPALAECPRDFQISVANEFYWFHGLAEEQYHLGAKCNEEVPGSGLYSMCVGASTMAKKALLELGDYAKAQHWAQESCTVFASFEARSPNWYNINYYYAEALAILERYPEAELAFRDTFRKQGAPVSEEAVAAFLKSVDQIKEAVRSLRQA